MIKAVDICKNYDDTNVLNNLCLHVKSGQFCIITGPSGTGKSTLLNVLSGLDSFQSGQLKLLDTDTSNLTSSETAEFRRKNIGFIFQSYNLISSKTALENVALPLKYNKVKYFYRRSMAITALNKMGLEEKLHSYPYQLSGGQQQRVAIARAIVNDAPIIFADEPTGNLDTKMSIEIMELFTKLNQQLKRTIILVTHEEDIAHYANRIIKIVDGEIHSDTINKYKRA